jgi:hypothetical protein
MEVDPTDTVINFGDADKAMRNTGVCEEKAWRKDIPKCKDEIPSNYKGM